MKNILILVCLILFICTQTQAQTFTDSNLPIVVINIDGNGGIPDEPRAFGTMKIIRSLNGKRNFLSDLTNPDSVLKIDYNGRVGIETRGSSSQALQKKQYNLTTYLADNVSKNNVRLLDMPKENDWILSGMAFDPSFIRDYLSFTLSRNIGEYAPRSVYCELVVNGEYRGLYMLVEKIKVDDNRVDIIKMDALDITLPDLSGGYITKSDKIAGQDVVAWTMPSYIGSTNFTHSSPKPSEITSQQHQYIFSIFSQLAATTQSNNISLTDGYPSVIDVPSFINFMLVNELAANIDAYQFSTYFHKDKNAKLRAGPLWDINLSYGNDLFLWGLDRSKTYTWQFNNGDNTGARFWLDLFNNSTYKCYLAKRWNSLTQSGQPLNLVTVKALIDATVAKISEAAARDQAKWNFERGGWLTSLDLPTQIAGIKSFLDARTTWMTTNLGSFSACSNVTLPPLVISRINYNPGTSTSFPNSSEQEFIEIVNNGNTVVNLTGVYFSGTGFVYRFPAGATVPAQGVLQLANQREIFTQVYGHSPYDVFTRSLNNDNQKLTLADGFGNVIDEVNYSDQAPWPDADGNGSYLKLTDADLDNNVGANWIASSEPIGSTITGIEEVNAFMVQVYPNPVENIVRIRSNELMSSVQLHDIHGRVLETIPANRNALEHNMGQYPSGVYLLKLTINGRLVVRKVVKK